MRYSLGGLDLATTTGTVYSKRSPSVHEEQFRNIVHNKGVLRTSKTCGLALVCTGHATNAETNPSHVFDKMFYFNFFYLISFRMGI